MLLTDIAYVGTRRAVLRESTCLYAIGGTESVYGYTRDRVCQRYCTLLSQASMPCALQCLVKSAGSLVKLLSVLSNLLAAWSNCCLVKLAGSKLLSAWSKLRAAWPKRLSAE